MQSVASGAERSTARTRDTCTTDTHCTHMHMSRAQSCRFVSRSTHALHLLSAYRMAVLRNRHTEATSGAHDQHTSCTHGKAVVGASPMSWSFQRAELPDQGCKDRFMTVVDDFTNVDCRAPQVFSERLPTQTFQELINA